MSDIYLSLTETPAVVTLSQPVVASVMVNTVTVANVVSVNVVTMPAINVTAAVSGGLTNAELRASAVTVALDASSLAALESVTVTVGNVTIGSAVTIAGFSTSSLPPSTVTISNFPSTQTIAGTVTANVGGIPQDSGIPYFPVAFFTSPQGAVVQVSDDSNAGLPVRVQEAISGTVTANVGNYSSAVTNNYRISGSISSVTAMPVVFPEIGTYGPIQGYNGTNGFLHVGLKHLGNVTLDGRTDLPISGTVTANFNDPTSVAIANQIQDALFGSDTLVEALNNQLILPAISGTVTANNPNGALTTRFGSVTTANTAELTSAVTNSSRKYLLVQNIDSSTVTIGIGFTPTTTQGIQLTAGGGLTFDAFCPTGAVYWLSSVTGSNWSILEG